MTSQGTESLGHFQLQTLVMFRLQRMRKMSPDLTVITADKMTESNERSLGPHTHEDLCLVQHTPKTWTWQL